MTKQEYMLVVDKGYTTSYYPKRDLEHARTCLEHAERDFKRHSPLAAARFRAWIETRMIGDWEKHS